MLSSLASASGALGARPHEQQSLKLPRSSSGQRSRLPSSSSSSSSSSSGRPLLLLQRPAARRGRHASPPQAAAATAAVAPPPPPPPQQQQQPRDPPEHQQQQPELRGLYPASGAHDSGHLRVSELHTLYYEVHGNPAGVPALFLHGGPGAGCWANHARFFDPRHYRVVLVDQRGCGRSTPYGALAGNTTGALVSDLELLRRHLGVQQWLVLGGSWGVALALAYAQAHPSAVLGLVLRGVCLMRPREISWMYGGGAGSLRPLAWARFLEHLSPAERAAPLLSYYQRLLSSDACVRAAAAKAWLSWEMAVGFGSSDDLLVWDGQQWGQQPSPTAHQQQQQPAAAAAPQQPQQLLPAPRPAGPAAEAAAAAAASAGSLSALLLRDERGSAWHASLADLAADSSSSSSNNVAPISGHTAGGAAGTSSTHPHSYQQQQQPDGRRTGGDTDLGIVDSSSSSTGGGVPTDPTHASILSSGDSQQQLLACLRAGLQHRGARDGGGGGHAQALLEAHYSVHGAFLQQQPLLAHVDRLRHIPCIMVQGQADLVTPPVTAVELGCAWPEAHVHLVPRAGHSMYDPCVQHELVSATDRMRALQPVDWAAHGAGGTAG